MKKLSKKQEQKDMKLEANDLENVDAGQATVSEILPDASLLKRITELEDERDKLKDQLLRTAADFENFRRRNVEDRAQWIRNASERLSLEVCDVLDNFDRALTTEEGPGFVEGVRMIRQQIESLLKKEGVERIDAREAEFNPMVHEAMAMIPSKVEQNRIVEVVQNGYIMNGKVIRAAKVVVSGGQPPVKDNKEE